MPSSDSVDINVFSQTKLLILDLLLFTLDACKVRGASVIFVLDFIEMYVFPNAYSM